MEQRSLGDADRAAAIALWEACGLTRPWNDALVATAMVGEDGHRGWMYYVAVDPSRRSDGIGRQVVDAAEAWLRARGVVKVNLMVRHDIAAAVGFYDHLGYEDQQTTVLARWLS